MKFLFKLSALFFLLTLASCGGSANCAGVIVFGAIGEGLCPKAQSDESASNLAKESARNNSAITVVTAVILAN